MIERVDSGMKRNWLSLSKAFLRDLDRPIYTLVRSGFQYRDYAT